MTPYHLYSVFRPVVLKDTAVCLLLKETWAQGPAGDPTTNHSDAGSFGRPQNTVQRVRLMTWHPKPYFRLLLKDMVPKAGARTTDFWVEK